METPQVARDHSVHDSHEATPCSESQSDAQSDRNSDAHSSSRLEDSPVPHLDAAAAQQLLQSLPALLGSPIDNLTCQWVNCGDRETSAEALYDHVCEKHIGRKSTNNLNLTCQWGLCRITTVKRDHITSHMRVHVPLKPHKCEFCNKSFKRPQDLKKHVKTHADDSVGLQSPATHQSHMGAGYGDDKGYYGNHDLGMNPYAAPLAGHGGYFPQQYASYGAPGYAGASLADQHSMETRRRAIEALNDFLGDIKRRSVDPKSYIDVGQRFNPQALPLPVSTGAGYSLGGSAYQHAGQPPHSADSYGNGGNGAPTAAAAQYPQAQSGAAAYAPAQNYALPMSNVRTKTDLQDIDRFLEQLQATVYDSNPVSQSGFREVVYNNAPGYNSLDRPTMPAASQPLSSMAQMATMSASSQGFDTPALTSSSVSSHTSSAHSPNASSSHSHSSIDGSMYPQLPSVTGVSESGQYSSAPPSGLASSFDAFDSRRFRGGILQRAAPGDRPSIDSQAMEVDETDGSRTPQKLADISEDEQTSKSDETVDPALREELRAAKPDSITTDLSKDEKASETDARKDSTSTEADPAETAWTENVRAIEALRNWIRERLEQGAYERDGDSTPTATHHEDTEMLDEASEKDLGQALKHSLERQEAEAAQAQAALNQAQAAEEHAEHAGHDLDMSDRPETRERELHHAQDPMSPPRDLEYAHNDQEREYDVSHDDQRDSLREQLRRQLRQQAAEDITSFRSEAEQGEITPKATDDEARINAHSESVVSDAAVDNDYVVADGNADAGKVSYPVLEAAVA